MGVLTIMVSVLVAVTPVAPPPATLTAQPLRAAPGATIMVSGHGFGACTRAPVAPGPLLELTWDDDPEPVARGLIVDSGDVAVEVPVPADTTPGRHRIATSCAPVDGGTAPVSAAVEVTVVAVDVTTSPPVKTPPADRGAGAAPPPVASAPPVVPPAAPAPKVDEPRSPGVVIARVPAPSSPPEVAAAPPDAPGLPILPLAVLAAGLLASAVLIGRGLEARRANRPVENEPVVIDRAG
jgi:hypothetical protein